MKRILSLIMVVVMLFAVLAFVGCDNNENTTTEASTTETTDTTASETTASETTESETTASQTTESETTASETTTVSDTTTNTTTSETTTPSETTTTVTVPTESTTITSGTTLPIFARFDFGTNTKAEAEGWTSHEYITSILTYNENFIEIEWTEDSIVIWSLVDYATASSMEGFDVYSYALNFDDIVTYDFDDVLLAGWGTWNGYPQTSNNVGKSWVGRHQYMKIRIKNTSENNMISFMWRNMAQSSYSTAMIASGMYLQGGAPTTTSNHNLTTTPTDKWANYIYDIGYLAGYTYYKNGNTSYVGWTEQASTTNGMGKGGGNNWYWNVTNSMAAVKFHLLGAYGRSSVGGSDSRANIKAGARVEVDYIVFGSSIEQLNGYTSYAEDNA